MTLKLSEPRVLQYRTVRTPTIGWDGDDPDQTGLDNGPVAVSVNVNLQTCYGTTIPFIVR